MISRGVVIKKTDVGEDNQLITFYTRDFGKLTGIAKSIKKSSSKQASHLEIFNLVDFRLAASRIQPIVASAQSLDTFFNLKNSLPKLAVGYFLLEAFNRLIYDYEKDPALWNFLQQTLQTLNGTGEQNKENLKLYLTSIKKDFLGVMGYASSREAFELNNFLEFLNQQRMFSLDFLNAFN